MTYPNSTAVWLAAARNDINEIQQHIQQGFAIDEKGSDGGSLLHFAARAGNIEVASFLLKAGADINLRRDSGGEFGKETPLYLAVEANHPRLADFLLQHGANPNLKSKEGYAPTDLAADRGDMGMVQLLVTAGAKLNQKRANTPLLYAVSAGHIDIAEYLVERGANFDVRNAYSETLLIIAARSKRLSSVDFVLKHAPQLLNAVDDRSRNALHNAVAASASRITSFTPAKGGVPPKIARQEPEDAIPVVARLLQAGIDRNVRDKEGMTPLDWAKLLRAKAIVDMLTNDNSFVQITTGGQNI